MTTDCDSNEDYTIMIIGASGTGKSTLANLIAYGPPLCDEITKKQLFLIADGVVSGTKAAKPVSSNGYYVIDTMGLFQMEDRPVDALEKLADAVENASSGINTILFCTDGRLRPDTCEAFKVVERLFGEKNCKQRLVLVYTKADQLAKKNYEVQRQFIEKQQTESKKFREMLEKCGDRWVITGIPELDDDSEMEEKHRQLRGKMHAHLLSYLKEKVTALKFAPSFHLSENVRLYGTVKVACDRIQLETEDDEEMKRMIDDLSTEMHESYVKSLKEATRLEIEKLVKDPPVWLSESLEMLREISNFSWSKDFLTGISQTPVDSQFDTTATIIGAIVNGAFSVYHSRQRHDEALATVKAQRMAKENAIIEKIRQIAIDISKSGAPACRLTNTTASTIKTIKF